MPSGRLTRCRRFSLPRGEGERVVQLHTDGLGGCFPAFGSAGAIDPATAHSTRPYAAFSPAEIAARDCVRNRPGVMPIFFLNITLKYSRCSSPIFSAIIAMLNL